jgi:hypothetical protein
MNCNIKTSNVVKGVLTVKFICANACTEKEESPQMNSLILYFRELEKEQTNQRAEGKK